MRNCWDTSPKSGAYLPGSGLMVKELTCNRFESVTDRFLTELGPIAAGQVAKDADMRFENLVKGLKHIHIKVGSYLSCWYERHVN